MKSIILLCALVALCQAYVPQHYYPEGQYGHNWPSYGKIGYEHEVPEYVPEHEFGTHWPWWVSQYHVPSWYHKYGPVEQHSTYPSWWWSQYQHYPSWTGAYGYEHKWTPYHYGQYPYGQYSYGQFPYGHYPYAHYPYGEYHHVY